MWLVDGAEQVRRVAVEDALGLQCQATPGQGQAGAQRGGGNKNHSARCKLCMEKPTRHRTERKSRLRAEDGLELEESTREWVDHPKTECVAQVQSDDLYAALEKKLAQACELHASRAEISARTCVSMARKCCSARKKDADLQEKKLSTGRSGRCQRPGSQTNRQVR